MQSIFAHHVFICTQLYICIQQTKKGLESDKLHVIVVSASNVIAWSAITPISMWVAGTMVASMVTVHYTIVVFVAQTITCIKEKTVRGLYKI
jgi:adenylylsulfate kinase-like enzyme